MPDEIKPTETPATTPVTPTKPVPGGDGGGSASLEERLKALEESNAKLAANNKALLDEKIKAKQSADEEIKRKEEEARKKAEQSGDSAAMLEITKKELQTLQAKLADEAKKAEERELTEKEKAQQEAFKEDMKDYEFHDWDDTMRSVNWKKYVSEKKDGKYVFDADGRKQAKEEFLKKYSYKIKPKDGDPLNSKARPSETQETSKSVLSGFFRDLDKNKS